MKTKIYLISFILLIFCTSGVFADGTSGCGIGTKMWKGESGFTAHSSADSSNTSQEFSITSGTSGCDASKTVGIEQKQEAFIASNMEILNEEISQGHGEYLNTFAVLMGCPENSRNTFSAQLKAHVELFDGQTAASNQLMHQTKNIINRNSYLKEACRY